jgi:hypothetical protein
LLVLIGLAGVVVRFRQRIRDYFTRAHLSPLKWSVATSLVLFSLVVAGLLQLLVL